MQQIMAMLIALGMSLGGFIAQATGDGKAAQLLVQARTALGGEARLAKVHGLECTGTSARDMAGQQMSGELTLDLQLPDKMLRSDSMRPFGDATIVTEQGISGDQFLSHAKTINGGPNMVIRMPAPAAGSDAEAQAIRNQRAEMARLVMAMLLTSSPAMPLEFTSGGEAESPDGKADVLDVKGPNSFAAKLLLDQKTHRPLMLVYRGVAPRIVMQQQRGPAPAAGAPSAATGGHGGQADATPPPQQVDVNLFMDDYKQVDGIWLPHHLSRAVDGKTTEELTFTSITINPAFKPDTFVKK